MARLDGKVALVTGGASGIGAATVQRLLLEGATVTFTDVSAAGGEKLAAATGSTFIQQDVTDETAWARVVASIEQRQGRLDILVNNAGIISGQTIDHVDLATWNRVLAVNLTGVMLGCREGVAAMRRNLGGSAGTIINISSNAGILGSAADVAYSASKGAVTLLTKSVAAQCARSRWNIRCNSVHPGAVRTPLFDPWLESAPDQSVVIDALSSLCPLGRMGRPEEVASMVAYLASDESAFATGAEFVLDGGATCALPAV
jgi:NAD(P)-dependent dehydrogenase (short-subunit alcohol dehydrogenase family)